MSLYLHGSLQRFWAWSDQRFIFHQVNLKHIATTRQVYRPDIHWVRMLIQVMLATYVVRAAFGFALGESSAIYLALPLLRFN